MVTTLTILLVESTGSYSMGSIDGLTPNEALSAVLPASGLTFRREGDRLIVSAAR